MAQTNRRSGPKDLGRCLIVRAGHMDSACMFRQMDKHACSICTVCLFQMGRLIALSSCRMSSPGGSEKGGYKGLAGTQDPSICSVILHALCASFGQVTVPTLPRTHSNALSLSQSWLQLHRGSECKQPSGIRCGPCVMYGTTHSAIAHSRISSSHNE